MLAQVPKGSAEMVAAAIRTIFAQPDAEHVREQLDTIAGMLGRQLPKWRPCCTRRPKTSPHSPISLRRIGRRSGLVSTNPLERLNKEIKHRTDVVGVFPNPAAHCGWLARFSSKHTTSGKSPTNGTSPKPPWRY